jgi:hypothetical protein
VGALGVGGRDRQEGDRQRLKPQIGKKEIDDGEIDKGRGCGGSQGLE